MTKNEGTIFLNHICQYKRSDFFLVVEKCRTNTICLPCRSMQAHWEAVAALTRQSGGPHYQCGPLARRAARKNKKRPRCGPDGRLHGAASWPVDLTGRSSPDFGARSLPTISASKSAALRSSRCRNQSAELKKLRRFDFLFF